MAGIYIHVPFCKGKCTYCDFASFPNQLGKMELYFGCLYKEIKAKAGLFKDKEINTIYFGGGTPSYVDAKYILGAEKITSRAILRNILNTRPFDRQHANGLKCELLEKGGNLCIS